MGGSIRTVHVIDKKYDIQTRWTNSLPEYVKSSKFVLSDMDYIKSYLNRKSEYRNEKETFSPTDYGLDVFDFDNKTIINCQGYCRYDDISYCVVSLYNNQSYASIDDDNGKITITPITKEDEEFYPTEVKQMWEKNMLSVDLRIRHSDIDKIKNKSDYGKTSFEDILKQMANFEDRDNGIASFKIKWADFGWKLKVFEPDNLLGFYNYIKENYKLTSEDINDWEGHINERCGDY